MPSWAISTSTPRSSAIWRSSAPNARSSPSTISDPQWVTIILGTPVFWHQVSWVRTGVWPMRESSLLRTIERVTVAPSPT